MAASDPQTFGALLRQHRLQAGFSQETLAERAQMSAAAIAALERGRRTKPHPETVTLLAAALALDPAARAAFFATAIHTRAGNAGGDEPPVAPAPLPALLPVPPNALVGREHDADAVAALLGSGARLVTLVGPGGVGKTRLALAVATRVREGYAAVCFVALAPVTDPALVLVTVAQALGMRESREQRLLERVIDLLRDQRVLLVLDNCEQVIAAAPQITALLAAASGLAVLVTSRERLRLSGEQTYPVPPLSLPEAGRAPLADLRQYAAIRLFVERARAVQPGFVLTDENAAAVAAICRHLDGLPLAIELAAVRVRILSPAALLARLEHRLHILTSGPRDQPERQRTLRGAIDWSYHLLGAEEQRLFRLLAVFADGMTLPAVEAVCETVGGSGLGMMPLDPLDSLDPLDGLESLLDKSLLIRLSSGAHAGETEQEEGEPRFAMLETIREYAFERLTAQGEAEAARRAHARHFLARVDQGAGTTEREAAAWRNHVAHEQGNLRAALSWAIASGEGEVGARLVVGLAPFWWARGSLHEGRRWIDAALAVDSALPPVLRARALREAGAFAAAQGDSDLAIARYEASRSLLDASASPLAVAALLGDLAMAVFQRGEGTQARDLLHEALALQEEAGDDRGRAGTHNRLGLVESQYGDPLRGEAEYAASIALARMHADRPILAGALNNLGNTLLDRGEGERAAALFAESVALRRALDDKMGLPISLHSAGEAARRRGDMRTAMAFFSESLTLRRALGERRGVARCLESIAAVALAEGMVMRAARLLGAAIGLRTQLGAAVYRMERGDVEETTRMVRVQLGAAMDTALAVGRALPLDEAVAEALTVAADDTVRAISG